MKDTNIQGHPGFVAAMEMEFKEDRNILEFESEHNLMEYKSPSDSLDIDTFYKVTGYACLYKSYGKTTDGNPYWK